MSVIRTLIVAIAIAVWQADAQSMRTTCVDEMSCEISLLVTSQF